MYCSMYTRAKFQFGNGFHLKLDVARPQVQVKEVLRDAPWLLPPANGFKAWKQKFLSLMKVADYLGGWLPLFDSLGIQLSRAFTQI